MVVPDGNEFTHRQWLKQRGVNSGLIVANVMIVRPPSRASPAPTLECNPLWEPGLPAMMPIRSIGQILFQRRRRAKELIARLLLRHTQRFEMTLDRRHETLGAQE